MSKAHLPPVPPDNRAPVGRSATPQQGNDMPAAVIADNMASKSRNLGIQGRQGSVKTNTTHPGYQQDR